MTKRTIRAGTRIFFGAPAKPMPVARADAIAQAVAGVHGITEAHLPQCFVEGDKVARQVLVIGVQRRDGIPIIAGELMRRLHHILPSGEFIDILPFEAGAMPVGVREAGCQIFPAEKQL